MPSSRGLINLDTAPGAAIWPSIYGRATDKLCRSTGALGARELGIGSLNDKLRGVIKDVPPSVVVFLIALPLSMGIARASGMPAMLGLITAIVGGIVAGYWGGAPLVIAGPSAGLSVLVLEMVEKYRTDEDPFGIASIAVIVLIAGSLQAAAGFLKLGTYFRAVSPAVIRGMLAGIGLIIVIKQFHVMLDDDIEGSVLYDLYRIPAGIGKGFSTGGERYHYIAASIGVATLLTIVLWDRFRPERLRHLPGALAGVLVASIAAAVLRLPIEYVVVDASLFSYITLPTAGSLTKLADTRRLGFGTGASVRCQRGNAALRHRRLAHVTGRARTHRLRSRACRPGHREPHLWRPGVASNHRRHQPELRQRRGRRAHEVVRGTASDLDSRFRRAWRQGYSLSCPSRLWPRS